MLLWRKQKKKEGKLYPRIMSVNSRKTEESNINGKKKKKVTLGETTHENDFYSFPGEIVSKYIVVKWPRCITGKAFPQIINRKVSNI